MGTAYGRVKDNSFVLDFILCDYRNYKFERGYVTQKIDIMMFFENFWPL